MTTAQLKQITALADRLINQTHGINDYDKQEAGRVIRALLMCARDRHSFNTDNPYANYRVCSVCGANWSFDR